MDAIILVTSNSAFETIAAFAIFGVVGYLGMSPNEGERLGAFTFGFLTLPEAVTAMPGANFWAIMLFFTLVVLGYSSVFAMVDAIVTMVMDAHNKFSRPIVDTAAVFVFFLLSLPFCTEFGYYLLTGVDRWINNVALIFIVWAECCAPTTVYRWKDAANQVGSRALILYNCAFYLAMILGCAVAQAVGAQAGAGVGFGLFIVGTLVSVLIAQTPNSPAPRFWGKYVFAAKFWYLAFYSGNQLRRDLNVIVATGKNWKIPAIWPFVLRYVSAPILAIVYSFSYPGFYELRDDPLHIFGFAVVHFMLVLVGLGLIVPRWFDVFVLPHRRDDGVFESVANEPRGTIYASGDESMESGTGTGGRQDGIEGLVVLTREAIALKAILLLLNCVATSLARSGPCTQSIMPHV